MKNFAIAMAMFLVLGCSVDNVLSEEAQLKKDTAIIDKYLAQKGITPTVDPSGLRLVVEVVGTGTVPEPSSKLTVIYKGKFLSNGAVFDENDVTTSGQPKPFETPLANLIKGWQYGFQYVAKGGKATFYVPSSLAYGHEGRGIIPSNANLIFEIELIGFVN